MRYSKETILSMYLDYVENCIDVNDFAEYYSIKVSIAYMLIKAGRILNTRA